MRKINDSKPLEYGVAAHGHIMRQISQATGNAPRALESVGPPRFPRADRVGGPDDPFWKMAPQVLVLVSPVGDNGGPAMSIIGAT